MDLENQKLISFHLGYHPSPFETGTIDEQITNAFNNLSAIQESELSELLAACLRGYNHLIEFINPSGDEQTIRNKICNHCKTNPQAFGENERLYWFSLIKISKILGVHIKWRRSG